MWRCLSWRPSVHCHTVFIDDEHLSLYRGQQVIFSHGDKYRALCSAQTVKGGHRCFILRVLTREDFHILHTYHSKHSELIMVNKIWVQLFIWPCLMQQYVLWISILLLIMKYNQILRTNTAVQQPSRNEKRNHCCHTCKTDVNRFKVFQTLCISPIRR